MSTEIALHPTLAHIHEDRVRLYTFEGERVDIEAEETLTGRCVTAVTTRTALFDAIRTELNVIVIDKAELPEVTVANDDRFVEINGESYGIKGLCLSREFHEQEAREHLAILRWLDENPPIDPKVAALADLLESEMVPIRDERFTDLARRLISSGRIDIKDPS